MRIMIATTFAAALLLVAPAWASEHPEHPNSDAAPDKAPSKGKGALDGKVFVGSLGKSGATTGDQDSLAFKKGTFVSSACVRFGFHEAPYSVEEKDGVVTFTSSATNAAGETMSWSGTVRNGALEGTAVHKTASGETTYWFKGKAGAAEAPHQKKSEHPEHPK